MAPAARARPSRMCVVILATLAIGWVALGSSARPAAAVTGPAAPQLLPPLGARAASSPSPALWIIGIDARRRRQANALAVRSGARPLAGLPAYLISSSSARSFARSLARVNALAFSEPDSAIAAVQSPAPGSLTKVSGWRSYIVADGLVAPPPGPLLAFVDTQAQVSHPAFAGSHITSTLNKPPTDEHGTGTIAVAAAKDTGLGFEGIYPGANALNIPTDLTCLDAARRVLEAIRHHAAVLNMSFGSSHSCFVLYLAVMDAVAHDVLPVAAAGNEFTKGNPLSFPASYPHVLTVGAIGPDLKPAFFSTSNLGVDLGAPGLGIVTAVPPQFQTDGGRDGYQALSGTSFAAPMVAAAADWIRAARPALTGQQVANVLRATAFDLSPGKKGYDTNTGYGLPRLGAALKAAAPAVGPREPNDDIPFVDGLVFGAPSPAIWAGRGSSQLSNLLDVFKNPADVYRISVPGHTRVRVDVKVRTGTAELAVYPSAAKTLSGHQLARILRIRAERGLTIINHGGRQVYYVAIGTQSIVTAYQLTVNPRTGGSGAPGPSLVPAVP